MKVYIVEINNGEPYEDNFSWIDSAFKSHRIASEYLLKEGYKPFLDRFMMEEELRFELEIDEYDTWFAKIIEMELQE